MPCPRIRLHLGCLGLSMCEFGRGDVSRLKLGTPPNCTAMDGASAWIGNLKAATPSRYHWTKGKEGSERATSRVANVTFSPLSSFLGLFVFPRNPRFPAQGSHWVVNGEMDGMVVCPGRDPIPWLAGGARK